MALKRTTLYNKIVTDNDFDYAIPGSHIIQLSLDIIYNELQELKKEIKEIKEIIGTRE